MAKKHPRAINVPLPKVPLGDHILRLGKARDATAIRTWIGTGQQVVGALSGAVAHLEAEDDASFVVVRQTGGPVGLFTIEVPHLQFAFFIDTFRGQGIATQAAVALVDHYFASQSGESWLGDSGDLSDDGFAFTRRLGFEAIGDEIGTTRLSRQRWTVRRLELRKV